MYPCLERNQERPAEVRRPPGCRTAVGGGGSCEGAAPSAHCLTADINPGWLTERRSSAVYSHWKTLHHLTQRLIFRQITLRCLMYRRKECTGKPQEILYIGLVHVNLKVGLKTCDCFCYKGTQHKLYPLRRWCRVFIWVDTIIVSFK